MTIWQSKLAEPRTAGTGPSRRARRSRSAAASCVAAVIVATTGCGADGGSTAQDPTAGLSDSSMSDAQKSELADKKVTAAEYEAAFQRLQACFRAAGFDVLNVSRTAYMNDFSVPDAAMQSGVYDDCYAREYGAVDTVWQLAHEDESPTNQMYKECLRKRGVEPAQKSEDVKKQMDEADLSVQDCIEMAAGGTGG
ncbi:hypothetical protein [Motilibacter deserti]|uniref:Host cell surface-exposed lipoprotein n=1 Tax=Motilibacter deserti TaxID=2714956 RepID=A0ABX0GUD7_9ACTN|nr:hypothetical protein [Motilibacter deserti]NHC14516.1 hypothetical protein [Motilibacter deserti]